MATGNTPASETPPECINALSEPQEQVPVHGEPQEQVPVHGDQSNQGVRLHVISDEQLNRLIDSVLSTSHSHKNRPSGRSRSPKRSRSRTPHGSVEASSKPKRSHYRRDRRSANRSRSRSPQNSYQRRKHLSAERPKSPLHYERVSYTRESPNGGYSPDHSDHSHFRDRSGERDSGSEKYSDREYSPMPSKKRKRYDFSSDDEESFPYMRESYHKFNPKRHTIMNNPTQIFWNNDIHNVKWHPNSEKKAFCLVKSIAMPNMPYMDNTNAHNTLTSSLGLDPWLGDNPGLKRKGFSVDFDPESGLGQALKLLEGKEDDLVQAILSKDEAAINKTFPDSAFSAPSMAIFSKNWPKSSEPYLAWAQGENLSLQQAARALDIDSVCKIAREDLDEERNARALLANNFSVLRTLEIFADTFPSDESKKSTIHAIARNLLPNIRHFLINWISTKLKIRRKILLNQDSTAHKILLRSNIWDPSIFPKDAIDQIKERGTRKDVRNILNLSNNGEMQRSSSNSNFNHKKSKVSGQWKFQEKSFESKPFRNFNTSKTNHKKQANNYYKKNSKNTFQKSGDKGNHFNSSNSQSNNQKSKKPEFSKNQKKNKKYTK